MVDLVPSSATVLTPSALATAMVSSFKAEPGLIWLDPCVGDGAFVSPIRKLGVAAEQLWAIDINPATGQLDSHARTLRGVDFVSWTREHEGSVDFVVMNPPYVSISKLLGAPKLAALECLHSALPSRPRNYNYWCAFVIAATRCLKNGGSMAAVLPAAWDYADYSASVRRFVEDHFSDVASYRSRRPLFPDVQEGSVVVIARSKGGPGCKTTRFSVDGINELVESLEQKTTPSLSISTTPELATCATLRDFATVNIGAVTGDTKYFLLTEAQRIRNGLNTKHLVPVVSRSRHIATDTIDRSWWNSLRDAGERVWMFRPENDQIDDLAVQAYLEYGSHGACNLAASHVKKRNPWYETRVRHTPDGFFSGMSKTLPVLAISAWKELVATNTLYQVHFRTQLEPVRRVELALSMLTSLARRYLESVSRHYPDGLVKIEPKDLLGCPVKFANGTTDVFQIYPRVLRTLYSGDTQEAETMANDWFELAK